MYSFLVGHNNVVYLGSNVQQQQQQSNGPSTSCFKLSMTMQMFSLVNEKNEKKKKNSRRKSVYQYLKHWRLGRVFHGTQTTECNYVPSTSCLFVGKEKRANIAARRQAKIYPPWQLRQPQIVHCGCRNARAAAMHHKMLMDCGSCIAAATNLKVAAGIHEMHQQL